MYPFEYARPTSIAEAAAAMDENSQYLAGGQSRIQAMKLRLSSVGRLVDLGAIEELRGIRMEDGRVVIGAMTTHAEVARSPQLRKTIPALCELAGAIGDQMIRNMGTIGGSIANADPSADYPAAILGLGAEVRTNRRSIPGDSFFLGLFTTALEPGELITAISFPVPQRAAYASHRQAASRFAMVGVFVSQTGGCVRVAVTGASSCVFRQTALEPQLARDFRPEVAQSFTVPHEDLNGDIHGSPAYRAHLVKVMAARAVAAALASP